MSKNRKEKRRPDTAGQRRGTPLPLAGHAADTDEPPLVGFISLGCAKNLVDSEKMLGAIAESGAIITGDESAADTIVVNTCGFLGAARDEALRVIRELVERKSRGELRRIVVAGCLVQRDGLKLLEEIPQLDALVGVHNRDDVPRAVWGALAGNPRLAPEARSAGDTPNRYLGAYHPQSWSDRGRLRLTPRHYAYVRISEGCNQKCTFCTIPAIRGPMHCKSPTELIAECRELLADGAAELILIGQDTTSYGTDLGYDAGLAGLLRTLNEACTTVRWLRLMYVYPSVFTDAMIDAIAECDRVVKYIDIPLQHINDWMLRAMGRRVTRRETEALLDKLRLRIPGVTIRTTFIVGFPGETEAEFAELAGFVRDFGFDAVGTFKYSFEAETPSARIPDQVEEALKEDRYGRLMQVQQEVAFAAARRWIGRPLEVVVDGVENGRCVARHSGQAPEVDGVCLLRGSRAPSSGTVVRGTCVATDGYDLIVQ
jgi:ribosomal protein S12 methylthiotransferase